MWVMIAGLVIFFAIHSVRMVAPGFRTAQIGAQPGRWKGLYALVSLLGFALIIWGWVLFRPVAEPVYDPPIWGRHAAMALVWVAFIMVVASNINMPAGRIKHWVKHPLLLGVGLWSIAHLLANGDMASVMLFGSFLVYGTVNGVSAMGRGDPAPVVTGPRGDVVALVAGTVLYAIFVLWLHGLLFGVSPLG
ncbi:NnrU family protein [Devosia rhodophyticola]|uniref:NnrU family protein n=1 Tax=Devosia rhodophyticola TaxID=3026423 RepID=A0ABY7YUE7_9HYPH|nr:NnrU family protein [Devosia rhodophyticola]WDR04822.1 NnrU family protein [Devosia rhodophyticola]